MPSQYAHYNCRVKEAITYREQKMKYEELMLHCVLHESVHYLCDAYAAQGIEAISSFWIVEGLAEYLGTLSTKPTDDIVRLKGDNHSRLNEFQSYLFALKGAWPLTLEDVLEIRNLRALYTAIGDAKKRDPSLSSFSTENILSWFYSASYCLCRYLDSQFPKQFKEYIALDLAGQGGIEAFRKVFEVDSVPDLEWTITGHFTNNRIKIRPESRRLAKSAGGIGSEGFRIPGKSPEKIGHNGMVHVALKCPDDAQAIRSILSHTFFSLGPDAALSLLNKLWSDESMRKLESEFEDDAKMIKDLKEFLADSFESMKESGDTYRLCEGMEKYRVISLDFPMVIARLEDQEEQTIPFTCIELDRLASVIKSDLGLKSDPRARGMLGDLYLLAGLKVKANREYARNRDKKKSRSALLTAFEKSSNGKHLLDLLNRDASSNPPDIAELEKLIKSERNTALVCALQDRFRHLTAYTIGKQCGREALLKRSFSDSLELDAEGRKLSLVYPAFDDSFLEDWTLKCPDCLSGARQCNQQNVGDFQNEKTLDFMRKKLILSWDQALVSRAIFNGDVTVELEAEFMSQGNMICGIGQQDGQGAILTSGMLRLQVDDYRNQYVEPEFIDVNDFALVLDQPYRFRILRTGDHIACSIGNTITNSMHFNGLKRGHAFLWFGGRPAFRIHSLSIEGDVDSQWLEEETSRIVEKWVDEIFAR
jgi:hypothetical protein